VQGKNLEKLKLNIEKFSLRKKKTSKKIIFCFAQIKKKV